MKLIWTDPAIEDLRALRDYIGRDSDFYAADIVEQMVLSVEKLLRFPRMGRVVPETQDENTRELLHQNCIYRIAGERIEILTIIHGSRDLTSLP